MADSVLDFLRSVDPNTLTPSEAAEYLSVLAGWRNRIAGATPVERPLNARSAPVRQVESPRGVSKPTATPLPSVSDLQRAALPHGPGNFSLIAARFRRAFGLTLSHGKLAKQSYAQNCQAFGEDFVLAEFENWQKSNQWMRDKGYTNLYQFYESLTSASEANKLIQADDEKVKRDKEKEASAVTDAVEAGARRNAEKGDSTPATKTRG